MNIRRALIVSFLGGVIVGIHLVFLIAYPFKAWIVLHLIIGFLALLASFWMIL